MITRRTFLRAAAWGAAPIAVVSFGWRDGLAWFVDRSTARLLAFVRTPEQQLRAHFDYLNLDPAGVERYFADYRSYRAALSPRLPLPSDVYTRYLLSSDFFRHGADESRTVEYVGFYDPDVTPCNNPLATFSDEALPSPSPTGR
jgi:hypothetical protein